MKCIIDVNVLLPLLCEGHSFQASAYAWLAALAESLNYEMVSCDRGFRRFALTSLHLLGEED